MGDGHDHQHSPGGRLWADLGSALELDGEILSPVLAQAIEWFHTLSPKREVSRILDLGCGPGVSTCQLAEAFPNASVVAVDGSADLLDRARARVIRHGIDSRVTTVEANIEAGVGPVGAIDLVWAAMVLHHVEAIDGVLGGVFDVLTPGGLLAVAEFGTPTQVLPDDNGLTRPALERRCHRAIESFLNQELPHGHAGVNWPSALTAAGFEFLGERDCVVDIPAPLAPADRTWAAQQLQRVRDVAGDSLDPDDLAALEVLVDPAHPAGVMHRPDVFIHTSRNVLVGQRPLER